MKYYMMRLYTQVAADGVTLEDKTAVYVHKTQTDALKQYFKMLANDIDDPTKVTSMCMVVSEYGIVIAKQRFAHDAPVGDIEEIGGDE